MAKTKLLLVTDSARIHTGLAETTRLIFKDLLNRYPDQYEIEQLGWFNFTQVEQVPWNIHTTNVTPKPGGVMEVDNEDRYGQRTFESVLAKVNPDIVWSFGDLWCFDHMLNSPNRNKFRLVVYYTIDGAPYFGSSITPGKSSEWGTKLVKADRIAVCTEFGDKVLHDSCPELKNRKIDVMYHPMDATRFKSFTPEEKLAKRKALYGSQVPVSAFILGWIGRNQFRKQNHKMWEVMHYVKHGDYIECKDCERITIKEWNWSSMEPHKGATYRYEAGYDFKSCWYCKSKNIEQGQPLHDAYLWQHMPKTDPGYNPGLHARMWDVEDRVIQTGSSDGARGLPPEVVAELMGSWDAMLYLSGGEGFGIPAFESLMSGVPVIYSNYSSHADFCKHGGLPVRCDFIPELAFGIHRAIADTGDAVRQILWAYRNRQELYLKGQMGRQFALSKNVTVVADQWHKLFQEMMAKPVALHGSKQVYAQIV